MADTHVNFVKQTVSGTPGTGAITLAGAVAKFRAMAATLDGITLNGATFSLSLEDGNNRSFETGCLYNSTAGTFARGTVESSTTGARLSLTSAAIVAVSFPASRGTAWDAMQPIGPFEAVTTAISLGADDVAKRYNTGSTSRAFTVPSALGDSFVGVTVRGPCTWIASGVTLTDDRVSGSSYAFCQLVQVASDVYSVVGVKA